MFGKKTLFIIGAGASAELGFPLGYELAKLIQQNTQTHIIQGGIVDGPGVMLIKAFGLKEAGYSDFDLIRAVRVVNRGVTYNASIDDFLSIHVGSTPIVQIGKRAIIQSILAAERQSKLASLKDRGQVLDTSTLENTWLLQLSQILIRGYTRQTVRDVFDNVAFVTFNYDRSLEIFLIDALKDGFAIRLEEACAIVKGATIIHAYGAVGNLPGLAISEVVEFGSSEHIGTVAIADLIQTYSESAADPDRIHREIENAEQMVFLGFAFHPQNMKLLKSQNPLTAKTFIATTYRMSELDVRWAEQELKLFFDPSIQQSIDNGSRSFFHPNAVKCAELMQSYALTLGQR